MTLDKDTHRRLVETVIRTRLFEEKVELLFKSGKMRGGVYPGRGNEAVSVTLGGCLGPDDVLCPTHRDIGSHFIRGESFRGMFMQLLGRAEGGCQGRDNGAHQGNLDQGMISMISHLAALNPVACGIALRFKIKKEKRCVATTLGDGSTSLGEHHEAMGMAAALKLPVIFVIENNHYAYSTSLNEQKAATSFADRGEGYGMPAERLEGLSIPALWEAFSKARDRALAGEGPSLIETVTMRLRGHSLADRADYVDDSLFQAWEKRDPYTLVQQEAKDVISAAECEALQATIRAEIDAAAEEALAADYPKAQAVSEGVFA